MKTTVLIDINVAAQVPPTTAWMVWAAPFMFDSGSTVVLPVGAPVKLVAGIGQVQVDPGVWVVTAAGPGFTDTEAWMVPESEIPVQFSSLLAVSHKELLGAGPTWLARAELAALGIIEKVESAAGSAAEALGYRNQAQAIVDAMATTTDALITQIFGNALGDFRQAVEAWGDANYLTEEQGNQSYVTPAGVGQVVTDALEDSDVLADAVTAILASAGVNDRTDVGWTIVPLLGQSNMDGRGEAYSGSTTDGYSAVTDPADSRVYYIPQSGTYAGKIVQATEPLAGYIAPLGMGPGLSFARWFAASLPTNRRVLLLDLAKGGVPFEGASGPTGYTWKNGRTDVTNLLDNAVAKIQQALALAGANATIGAILWGHGETDGTNGASGATYRADLVDLLNRLRTDIPQAAFSPFLIGQMPKEAIQDVAARGPINAAMQALPVEVNNVAFAAGPPVDSAYINSDRLHYNARAQRFMGRSYFEAYINLVSPAEPVDPPATPTGVTLGTTTSGSQVISWTASPGANGYIVQRKKRSSSTWDTVSTPTATTFTVAGLDSNTLYDFRVIATNTGGSSAPTATVSTTTLTNVPTVIFADSFDGADGPVTLTETGELPYLVTPSSTAAVFGRAASKGKYTSQAASGAPITYVDAGMANGKYTVVIDSVPTFSVEGLGLRVTSNNYLIILGYRVSGTDGHYRVVSKQNGTSTQIGAAFDVVPAAGDVIEVTLNGAQITIAINGVVKFDQDVTAQQAGTGFGFYTGASAPVAVQYASHKYETQ